MVDIKRIDELPLEQQAKELENLKTGFLKDQEDLKNEIRRLEDSKKDKQKEVAYSVGGTKQQKQAELSALDSTISHIRNDLRLKGREIDFVNKAVDNIKRLLKESEDSIIQEHIKRELKEITDQLIQKNVEESTKEREERVKRLEELFGRKSKEDLKKEDNENKVEKVKKKTLEDEINETEVSKEAKEGAKNLVDYMKGTDVTGRGAGKGIDPDKVYQTGEPQGDYISNPAMESTSGDYTSNEEGPQSDYASRENEPKSDYMSNEDAEVHISDNSHYHMRD